MVESNGLGYAREASFWINYLQWVPV